MLTPPRETTRLASAVRRTRPARRRGSLRPAVLGAALALLALGGCPGRDPGPPAVVLVIVDTLRADHLSAYGYGRPTSPNLARLAAEAELYREAWAQSPWTLPAVATILTGQGPWVHGAGRQPDGALVPLRPGIPTLAERLREAGYRTGAVINVVFCAPRLGLARGFEVYDFATTDATNRGHRDARATTDAALAFARRHADEPFLLVVHYFDPHLTYDPPAPFDTMFEPEGQPRVPAGFGSASQVFALRRGELHLDPARKTSLVARYDGEIRFFDEQFARLRRGLERLGRWERSAVVVVADHGEEFWDHGGFEHGHAHHRELLRVPLIVKLPGRPPRTSDARVRQLDIVPTILDYAGLPRTPGLPGRPIGEGSAPYAVADGSLWAGALQSIRSDEGTLIRDRSTGRRRLYTADDPLETRDVVREAPELAAKLERILDALPVAPADEREPWHPDGAELERLRALGYVE